MPELESPKVLFEDTPREKIDSKVNDTSYNYKVLDFKITMELSTYETSE